MSLEQLYAKYPNGEFYYIENYGTRTYTDYNFRNCDEELFFVFGSETKGIPKELIAGKEERCLKIPMTTKVRSLNLSNTVAIIVYEVLRQQHFLHLT